MRLRTLSVFITSLRFEPNHEPQVVDFKDFSIAARKLHRMGVRVMARMRSQLFELIGEGNMSKLFSAVMLAAFAAPAFADVRPIPEPGTLSLVGLAVAVGIGLALRKRK